MDLQTSDFDYDLPVELIAQTPAEPRDSARLLVVNRVDGSMHHRHFTDLIEYLNPGDVMVFNDSRVLPARLLGKRTATGGAAELLLLRRLKPNEWEALVKPAKRLKKGSQLEFEGKKLIAEIIGEADAGLRIIKFSHEKLLPQFGTIALPPYIHNPLANPERYQTVYSRVNGSIAAPTAGLHFTRQLLSDVTQKGVKCLFVTLHIGLDTFRPIQEDNPAWHKIHHEWGHISQEVAFELTKAKTDKKRIICVGTTSVRLLEYIVQKNTLPEIKPFTGWVDLFILPGYEFKMVNAMVTNFHLPKSTLLLLVSAFAGKEIIQRVYQTAIQEKYRFYSFGDATLIL